MRRRTVTIAAPIRLHDKIELLRKNFKEVNGIGISFVEASEIFARRVRVPKIPNLLKNEKYNPKKIRPY